MHTLKPILLIYDTVIQAYKNILPGVNEWASSFLTAHHLLGYLVPYHGVEDLNKSDDIIKAIKVRQNS